MLDHPLGSLYVIELYSFELPDAGAPEQLLRQLVVARRAVEHDQLLPADLGDLCRPLLREPVLGVHHQHQLVLVQGPALDIRVLHLPREPELYFLLQDHLQNVLRVSGPDRDRHPRVRRRETLQDRWQSVRAYPRRRPQREPPTRSTPKLP